MKILKVEKKTHYKVTVEKSGHEYPVTYKRYSATDWWELMGASYEYLDADPRGQDWETVAELEAAVAEFNNAKST